MARYLINPINVTGKGYQGGHCNQVNNGDHPEDPYPVYEALTWTWWFCVIEWAT